MVEKNGLKTMKATIPETSLGPNSCYRIMKLFKEWRPFFSLKKLSSHFAVTDVTVIIGYAGPIVVQARSSLAAVLRIVT